MRQDNDIDDGGYYGFNFNLVLGFFAPLIALRGSLFG